MRISDWSSDVCSSDLGAEAIAPRAIGGGLDAEAIADRIAQRDHLRALQIRRQVAGIAVPCVHFLVVRRGHPWVELRPDLAAPHPLRGAQYLGGAVVGDRKSTRLNSSH